MGIDAARVHFRGSVMAQGSARGLTPVAKPTSQHSDQTRSSQFSIIVWITMTFTLWRVHDGGLVSAPVAAGVVRERREASQQSTDSQSSSAPSTATNSNSARRGMTWPLKE